MSNIFKDLVDAIKDLTKKTKASGSDYTGRVTRVDGTTAYVQLDGADIVDTPVALTINAVPGDKVRVRVNNGRAWLMGNDDAPPTDDRYARKVQSTLSGEIEETNGEVAAVKKTAQTANKIAGNTNQYFWHTQEGTDTGAHITEIPQEEFLADPANGGWNLLARSNGVAVRDGLDELAIFGAGMSRIGAEDGAHITTTEEKFCGYDADGFSTFEINSNGERESITRGVAYSWQTEIPAGGSVSFVIDVSDAIDALHPEYGNRVRLRFRHSDDPGKSFLVGFSYQRSESRSSWTPYGTDLTLTYNTDGYGQISMTVSTTHSTAITLSVDRITALVNAVAPRFVFGSGEASGAYAAAFGRDTQASSKDQTVIGKYNVEDTDEKYAFIIGNGTDDENRSNALAVDWDGNIESQNFLQRTSESSSAVSVLSNTWTPLCSFTGKANTTYLILYGAAFQSNAAGLRQLHFAATSGSSGRYSPSYAAANGDQTRMQGAITYTFTGAGTITLWARQTSGSALNVYGWYEAIKLPN